MSRFPYPSARVMPLLCVPGSWMLQKLPEDESWR